LTYVYISLRVDVSNLRSYVLVEICAASSSSLRE